MKTMPLREQNKIKEIIHEMDKSKRLGIYVGTSEEIAQTFWQHTKQVVRAAKIYARQVQHINSDLLNKMALYHDVVKYKEKQYAPGEISEEEKNKKDRAVILELQKHFGMFGDELFSLLVSYKEGETRESKIIKQLDIADAIVQAIEHNHNGANYDDALSKIQDPMLLKILGILLKREYTNIKIYDQYFALLKYRGDEDMFKKEMGKKFSS